MIVYHICVLYSIMKLTGGGGKDKIQNTRLEIFRKAENEDDEFDFIIPPILRYTVCMLV